eukprot:GHVL01017231.1.p1 GENE.GHVL01017231.1~~GHVL01017231.1.p1  ORF type:complete len:489 (+),score=103.41 GHVL01017231.1:856-2322(+)
MMCGPVVGGAVTKKRPPPASTPQGGENVIRRRLSNIPQGGFDLFLHCADEVLLEILDLIPGRAMCVCSRWAELVRLRRKHIQLTKLRGANMPPELVKGIIARSPSAVTLDLSNYLDMDHKHLTEIVKMPSFPKGMSKVSLRGNWKITDLPLSLLLRRCPNMESLDLIGCSGLSDGWLPSIRNRCSNIKHLAFGVTLNASQRQNNSSKYSNPMLKLFGSSATVKLESLKGVSYTPVTNSTLDITKTNDKTTSDENKKTENTIENSFYRASKTDSNSTESSETVDKSSETAENVQLTCLQTLIIIGVHQMNHKLPLETVTDTLSHLDIRGCFNLTDEDVESISSLTNLHTLNIADCIQLTAKTLTPVAKFCTKLRVLDISRIDVDDPSLNSLGELRSDLEKLKVTGCSRITDQTVSAFLAKLKNILHLELSFCRSITAAPFCGRDCALPTDSKLSTLGINQTNMMAFDLRRLVSERLNRNVTVVDTQVQC